MTAEVTAPAPINEAVIEIAGRIDEFSHAYDGNERGQTVCGLYPDKLTYRSAWKVVAFTRCPRCVEQSR